MAGKEKTRGMRKRLIAGAAGRGFGPAVAQEEESGEITQQSKTNPLGKEIDYVTHA